MGESSETMPNGWFATAEIRTTSVARLKQHQQSDGINVNQNWTAKQVCEERMRRR